MPLFIPGQSPVYSQGDGIGAVLHFIAEHSFQTSVMPKDNLCHCDDFRIIQVLQTTQSSDKRGSSYVDNAGQKTPFYGDAYASSRGEHYIPMYYPDAGERVQTTESIYDMPYRLPANLGTTSLSWLAEACVACLKNTSGGTDRILGCATYGFTRKYNATKGSFDPVVPVGPGCLSEPSPHFVSTLRDDPTTTSYNFEPAPDSDRCNRTLGDFPPPRDKRNA